MISSLIDNDMFINLSIKRTFLSYNNSSYDELMTVNGIGPSIAKSIISNRPWVNIYDLTEINGISKSRIEEWKEFIQL